MEEEDIFLINYYFGGRLHVESVHVDSMWSPVGVHLTSNQKKEIMWSLCGVVESMRNLWGRVKYTQNAQLGLKWWTWNGPGMDPESPGITWNG